MRAAKFAKKSNAWALVFSRSPMTFGASVIRCREGGVLRFLVLLPT